MNVGNLITLLESAPLHRWTAVHNLFPEGREKRGDEGYADKRIRNSGKSDEMKSRRLKEIIIEKRRKKPR